MSFIKNLHYMELLIFAVFLYNNYLIFILFFAVYFHVRI